LWEHNRFLDRRPALEATVESPYVRGAVTGVGLITGMAGLIELASVFAGRRRQATDPPQSPTSS